MPLTEFNLRQFTGSMEKHAISFLCKPLKVFCSDGVAYLAKEGNAYWLIDAILSHYPNARRQFGEEMQVWKLDVKDDKALLYCVNSEGKKIITQKIEFTDFPLETITLRLVNNMLYLPSEE